MTVRVIVDTVVELASTEHCCCLTRDPTLCCWKRTKGAEIISLLAPVRPPTNPFPPASWPPARAPHLPPVWHTIMFSAPRAPPSGHVSVWMLFYDAPPLYDECCLNHPVYKYVGRWRLKTLLSVVTERPNYVARILLGLCFFASVLSVVLRCSDSPPHI